MSPIIERIEQEFVLVDPGEYEAEVNAVNSKEGKYGFYLQFEFLLTEPDFEGVVITGNAPERFAADTKLDRWIAALGVDVGGYETGDTFDTDDLVGKSCRILVEHTKSRNKAGEDRVYANVSQVLPLEKKRAVTRPSREKAETKERAPRETPTRERTPRETPTRERTPRETPTRERTPRETPTRERAPRETPTRERTPREERAADPVEKETSPRKRSDLDF